MRRASSLFFFSAQCVILVLAVVALLILILTVLLTDRFTHSKFTITSTVKNSGRRQQQQQKGNVPSLLSPSLCRLHEIDDGGEADGDDDESAIDAVYTWVNGSDTLHLRARLKFLNASSAAGLQSSDANQSAPAPGDDAASASRFADHDELRYSMRSLEKFAPWVRRVYLVTNGQVPHWLDLSNPKVRVITHLEIFSAATPTSCLHHLPVFSSPAIESHLHRIPGLSKRFLYLNDDTFFASPVVPDDFHCPVAGAKIFLSWDIPQCAPGCPWSHLADKYCDHTSGCNVSACLWDGGDCLGVEPAKPAHDWRSNRHFSFSRATHDAQGRELCAPGCNLQDLSDQLCDAQCSTLECAFDNGFCGADLLEKVPRPAKVVALINASFARVSILPSSSPSSFLVNFSQLLSATTTEAADCVVENAYFNESEQDAGSESGGCQRIRTATFSRNTNSFIVTLHGSNRDIDSNHEVGAAIEQPDECHILFEFRNCTAYNSSDSVFEMVVAFTSQTDNASSSSSGGSNESAAWISVPVIMRNTTDVMMAREEQQPPAQIAAVETADRRLLDTYGDSLKASNLLLIAKFGGPRTIRKAPAHMVHLFERRVMEQLWESFASAMSATSASRFRTGTNNTMISFLHFYFMIHADAEPTADVFFARQMDMDSSGVIEPREERRIGLLLYEKKVPLEKLLESVWAVSPASGDFIAPSNDTSAVSTSSPANNSISNNNSNHRSSRSFSLSESLSACSRSKSDSSAAAAAADDDDESHLPTTSSVTLLPEEKVVPMSDEYLAVVRRLLRQAQMGIKTDICEAGDDRTESLLSARGFNRSHLAALLLPLYIEPEYKFELQTLDDVSFFMLKDNVTLITHQLDHVLVTRKKFICLNDNLNQLRKKSYAKIQLLLSTFFETLFPFPSKFERQQRDNGGDDDSDHHRSQTEYIWQSSAWSLHANDTARALARALQHGFTAEEFSARREHFMLLEQQEQRSSLRAATLSRRSDAAVDAGTSAMPERSSKQKHKQSHIQQLEPVAILAIAGWFLVLVLLIAGMILMRT